MTSRTVAFAGRAVRIETSGTAAADVVDFLFRHVHPCSSAIPHVTFRVTSEADMWALSRGECVLHEGSSPGPLASALLCAVTHALIDASRDGLVLHAAALGMDDLALVLPGLSGSGKTTFAVRLVLQGLGYLTDELVHAPCTSSGLEVFTRPIVVKHDARALVAGCLDFARDRSLMLGAPDAIMISPDLFSSPPPSFMRRPALLVFPHLQPNVACSLERLTKAQAAMALMSCVVNARNLPGHGLDCVSRIARQSPAYRITCGSLEFLDTMVRQVVRLWDEARGMAARRPDQ